MVVRNGFFVKPLYNDYKVKVKFDDILRKWQQAHCRQFRSDQ